MLEAQVSFMTVFNASPGGMIITRAADGSVVAINDAFCAMLGTSRRTALGRRSPDHAWVDEADRDRFLKRLKRSGIIKDLRLGLRTSRGRTLQVRASTRLMRHQGQECVLTCAVDVSAEERAKQKLTESNDKLQAALASMPDAVIICDTAGRLVEFNDAFATFHRFPRREDCAPLFEKFPALLRVYSTEGKLVPPQEWPLYRALRGESGRDVEYQLQRVDTGDTWIGSCTFAPVRARSGAIIGSVVTARDISRQKLLEEALRNVSLVVEQSIESVVITNLDGDIQYVNEAFVKKSGYSREEARGKNPRILKSDKNPPELYADMRRALAQEKTWRGELVNRRKDGSEYIEEISVSPLRHYDGSVRYYVGVADDITERKQLERAVLEAGDRERHRLGRDLHDGLGQELTGLSLMLSALSREIELAGDAATAHKLASLASAAGHCITTARRISHGLLPLEFSDGRFSMALERLVNATNAGSPGTHVELRMRKASLNEVNPSMAEAGYRIVQEALTNALRHGDAKKILVETLRKNGSLHVEITDDGCGLPADAGNGGMGLKIMQFRAAAVGGSVTVQNARTRGVVVRCVFPEHLTHFVPSVAHSKPAVFRTYALG